MELWARILSGKFSRNDDFHAILRSFTWRKLRHVCKIVTKFLYFILINFGLQWSIFKQNFKGVRKMFRKFFEHNLLVSLDVQYNKRTRRRWKDNYTKNRSGRAWTGLNWPRIGTNIWTLVSTAMILRVSVEFGRFLTLVRSICCSRILIFAPLPPSEKMESIMHAFRKYTICMC